VAVTVLAEPTLVLDRRYTVVEVGDAARAELGRLAGLNLWDCLPDAEPLFRPYYESAWRSGEPLEFVQFYDGRVERVRAVPQGERLILSWEVLAQLDTLTLEGLRTSIVGAISAIDGAESAARRERARSALRLVEDTP
jgi:hypothetical protein